jgi:ComF family protein
MNYLVDLFFPPSCLACSNTLHDNEVVICVECRHHLPLTNYHFNEDRPLNRLFFGRVQFVDATALFFFHKNSRVQKLLHHLKYNNQQSLGTILGTWLGLELKASMRFENIDLIVPVPSHKKRIKKRGYNQVVPFAKAIANVLNIPSDDSILIKIKNTKTQVFQTKEQRWKSVAHCFKLNKKELIYKKHILIVDDLITTGSTIESCSKALLDGCVKSLSLAAIAITSSMFRQN